MERTTTETCIPPAVARICDKLGIYGTARMEFAAKERARHGDGKYPSIDVLNETAPEPTPEAMYNRTIFHGDDDKAEIAKLFRESRKCEGDRFTSQYIYDNNIMEQRCCVSIDNDCYWPEKSSGITWIGVHGEDSVCVVTTRDDLDIMRLHGNVKVLLENELRKKATVDLALSLFRKSIICEIEDLGDPSSELHQKFQGYIKKPFGVVSVNPRTNNIKAFDYDENKAIEFLRKKTKRDTDFDVYETKKTAIHAFQHLSRKKLEADEIEVSLLDPGYVFVATGEEKPSSVQELPVCEIATFLDDSIGGSGLSEMEIPMRAITYS